jgi:hypothetical protein
LIVLASQARWARQTLNCLQHRLEQAAWFWMAAAVAIAAKHRKLLQDAKPLLQRV